MKAHAPLVGLLAAFGILFFVLLPSRLHVPMDQTFLDDANDYHTIASNVALHGSYSFDGITPVSEREPGYPLFLGAVYRVFGVGNRLAIFVMQAIVYAAAALFFLLELRRATSSRIALMCGFFLFLEPVVFHLVLFVYRELLALALCLVTLGAGLRLLRTASWGSAVLMGLAAGFLTLTYMPLLPAVAVLPFALLLLKTDWKKCLVVFVLFALCIGAWAYRNGQYESTAGCRLGGCTRGAGAWYVRARQAEQLHGLDPLRCLVSQYITLNKAAAKPACRFGETMNSGGVHWNDPLAAKAAQKESITTIIHHLPQHLWISLFYVGEFHLPYVNGWGMAYNLLEALATAILLLGVVFAIPSMRRREVLFLLVPIVITTIVLALIDVEPRYRTPLLGAYAAISAIGWSGILRFKRYDAAHGRS